MIHIPFLTQDDLILDNQKRIIPGAKIDVYDPISNNRIDIYTYDGANERYIVAENPIYLDNDSRPQHTYFSTKLVLCRLYKYRGQLSNPMTDDDTANWEFVREWNGAFSQDQVKNDTIVFGLSELQEVNTELGSVNVVGYWNNYDCEGRTYVWDATCTQTPDNGYIVKNNEKDTGRWILKFDGEYLPSTYYGVYPGKEANMNALLTYVATAGTNGMKTAPGVYFYPGDYDASTVALTTDKRVLIDAGTTFTRASITASDVKVIGKSTQAITDLYTTDPNATVHSSWYKTIEGFLRSGAKHLIFDATNYFTDSKLYNNITLSDKIVEYTSRISIDFNGHYITFSGCEFIGERFINGASDYYIFQYTNMTDRWFTSSAIDWGYISRGHHIQATTQSANRIELSNFESADAWLKLICANAEDLSQSNIDVDLQGRTLSSAVNYNVIGIIRNAVINSKYSGTPTGGSITFYNTTASIGSVTAHYFYAYDSKLTFDSQPTYTSGAMLVFKNCEVGQTPNYGSNWWTNSNSYVIAEECDWSVAFDYTNNDNTTPQGGRLTFRKCIMTQTNNFFRVKDIVMTDCILEGQNIKIYPYKENGVDSVEHYFLGATFMNNKMTGNYPIELTKYDDDNCFNVFFKNLMIVGNTMYNSTGIECRYWQNRYGNNAAEKFIAPVLWFNDPIYATVQGHSFSYKNNIGNCPQENFKNLLTEKTAFTQEYQWPSYNTNTVATQRIFPPLNQSISNSPLYYSAGVGPLNGQMEIGYMPQTWNESSTYEPGDSHYYGYFGQNYYFQADYDLPLYDESSNPGGNGSLFNIGPAVGNTTAIGYDNMKSVVYIA